MRLSRGGAGGGAALTGYSVYDDGSSSTPGTYPSITRGFGIVSLLQIQHYAVGMEDMAELS